MTAPFQPQGANNSGWPIDRLDSLVVTGSYQRRFDWIPAHLLRGLGRPFRSSLGPLRSAPFGTVVDVTVPKKSIEQYFFLG